MDPETAPKILASESATETEGFLEAVAAVAPTSDNNRAAVPGLLAGAVGRTCNS